MRPDMHNLLVERGHAGRSWRGHDDKGWHARCRLRDGHDDDGDGWLPPHRRPSFSENLAPLYRYLAAQVGRPWDKVYSEIRSRINASNAVQYHILQHLYDRLAVHVTEDAAGQLWYVGRWGRLAPMTERWGSRYYVCPRTGLLRQVPRLRKDPEPRKTADRLPGPTSDHDYRNLAGQWYEVWWGRDALTNKPIIDHKRQLNRCELRDLGIRR